MFSFYFKRTLLKLFLVFPVKPRKIFFSSYEGQLIACNPKYIYDEMKKSSNKIKQRLEKSEMVEDIINEARNIEKMQKYIEKKGSIENLSEKEKQLLEKIK